MRIREIAQRRVRYGYRKIRVLLNREGWNVGKYLVYRLYKEESLALKKRPTQEESGATSGRELHRNCAEPSLEYQLCCRSSQLMDMWAYRNEVKINFSRSGKPADNAFCESFNGTFRSECLDTNWFQTLSEAKHLIEL